MTTPEPLVPAECTMSGNDWFPLHFDRLRKSKWWRRATDLARARNVMLWGEAYKQVPAGSMPDDDDELAEAAGFGMDVDAFMAAKHEIMSPWVFCADGRWYHPTVCEVVLEAWERTSERRKLAAKKKAAQRAKTRGRAAPASMVPSENAAVPAADENVPGDTSENGGDIDTHDRQDSTGQTEPPLAPQGGQNEDSGGAEKAADLGDGRPPRRKPAKPIPESFPDAAAIEVEQARARTAGANLDAAYQAGRFRNWAIGKDARYADWTATWRNWMAKAISEAPKVIGATPATTVGAPEDAWKRRVREFSRNGYWNRLEWGPPPGREGCKVSPEIQREFSVEPAKPQPVGRVA